MTLKLKKVSKYVNSLIKSKKGYDFPDWNLTKENSFWFALLCGVRGAGKTNAMLQILNIEKKGMLTDDNIVYWVSPTHDAKVAEFADKYPDNMKFYDELNIKVFTEIIDEIRERTEEWKQTKFIFDLFERYLKEGDDKLGDDEIEILLKSGILDEDVDVKKMIDEFNFEYPPRATLVLDDSMGSPLISSSNSKQGKEFTRWAIRHRHDFTNLFILTQHFKGISKPLRTNANAVLLFPSKDRATSKSIFDEFSSVFGGKMDNYLECLNMLDGEKVGSFLFIYYDKDKFLRLGFNQNITFTSEPMEKEDSPIKQELTI
jgi:hypothetical protein